MSNIAASMKKETLAQWRAEEALIRSRLQANPGLATSSQLAGRTGMEIFQAILDGEIPPPPMNATLDITPIHIEHGFAVFQGRPASEYFNPMGTVHGGWYATILDTAVGCAVHSTLPANKAYTTLELKLNFVRPLIEAVQLVRAEGRIIHAGHQVATAEGRLMGPDGKLYAHATTTCLIFHRE